MKKLISIFLFIGIPLGLTIISDPSLRPSFPKSRIGCFSLYNNILKLECTEQKLQFDLLDSLSRSRRKSAKKDLEYKVLERAKFFLNKKQYDYFSVVSLMKFPIKDKKEWLKRFSKIPGKRAPFTQIALARVEGKKSKFCRRKGKYKQVPIALKEICTI